jgi:hypothetical protein
MTMGRVVSQGMKDETDIGVQAAALRGAVIRSVAT